MTPAKTPRLLAILLAAIALGTVACEGPGDLTPAEVRWRWKHGVLVEASAAPGGVDVVVDCPDPHGGSVARYRIQTREVRIWERRDPFGRRDPLQFSAWRRCEMAWQDAHPGVAPPG